MLQLLSAVAHMHQRWYVHRDLKTSNLLMNEGGQLCVCDFGLARHYGSPLGKYTQLVVTLGYRAPELLCIPPLAAHAAPRARERMQPLFPSLLVLRVCGGAVGTETYSPAIDMWSVGCIFAELLTKDALFHVRGALRYRPHVPLLK